MLLPEFLYTRFNFDWTGHHVNRDSELFRSILKPISKQNNKFWFGFYCHVSFIFLFSSNVLCIKKYWFFQKKNYMPVLNFELIHGSSFLSSVKVLYYLLHNLKSTLSYRMSRNSESDYYRSMLLPYSLIRDWELQCCHFWTKQTFLRILRYKCSKPFWDIDLINNTSLH